MTTQSSDVEEILSRLNRHGSVGLFAAHASLGVVGRQAINFLASLAIARTLSVEAMGYAALVFTINAFFAIFLELGLVAALVSRKKLSASLVQAALVLNVLLCVLSAGVLALASGHISRFFDGGATLIHMLWFAVIGYIFSLSAVPRAILERTGNFAGVSQIELVASLVGQSLAVVLALTLRWPVAAALGPIAATCIETSLLWWRLRWWPKLRWDTTALLEIWNFCKYLLAFNFINYWSRNLDNAVVGRVSGPVALGLYSRSYQLMMLPLQQISTVVSRVLLPTLSRQRSADEVGKVWLSAARACVWIGAPIGAWFYVSGTDLTVFLYGHQWLPAGPILSILALAIPAQLISRTAGAAYQSLEKVRRQFVIGSLTTLIVMLGIVFGATGDALRMAQAVCAALTLASLVQMLDVARLVKISVAHLLKTLYGSLTLSVATAFIMVAVSRTLESLDHGSRAVIVLLAGLAAYSVASWLVLTWTRAVFAQFHSKLGARLQAMRRRPSCHQS